MQNIEAIRVKLKKFQGISHTEEAVFMDLDNDRIRLAYKTPTSSIAKLDESHEFMYLFDKIYDRVNVNAQMAQIAQNFARLVEPLVDGENQKNFVSDFETLAIRAKTLESMTLKQVYTQKEVQTNISLSSDLIDGFLATRYAQSMPELKVKFDRMNTLMINDYPQYINKFADYIKKMTQILQTMQNEGVKSQLSPEQINVFKENCRIFGDNCFFKHMRILGEPNLEKLGKVLFNQAFTSIDDLVANLAA